MNGNYNLPRGYGDNYNNAAMFRGSAPKKHGFLKALLAIIAVIVLLALIAGGVCFYLATQNNYDQKFTTPSSVDILSPLFESILLGSEQDVTDNDVNSLINYAFDEADKEADDSSPKPDLQITGAAINFHGDSLNDLYIKMYYKGIPLTIKSQCGVSLSGSNIIFTVENAKLGELPLPPKMIFDYFKQTKSYEALPSGLVLSDNKIIIPSGYSAEIEGYTFQLSVVSLSQQDGSAKIQTTSALESITDIITQYLFGK